ncbi:MAG TPA: sigma-54 dependent transcriptional regulator [Phycisphaerae bacterium]|nr:sigma-54 dependent transcriptional regulator [Phycisphaerae bacterium]
MRFSRTSQNAVLLVRSSTEGTEGLIRSLESRGGFDVVWVQSAAEAVTRVAADLCPLVLYDLADAANVAICPGPTAQSGCDASQSGTLLSQGLQVFRQIKQQSPHSQIVVLIAQGADVTTCCQAVVSGATSFVEWAPCMAVDQVVDTLKQALDRYEASVREGEDLRSRAIFDEAGIAGRSQIMAKLLFQAKRAALVSDAPVLVCGESGTGKQLLAEAIHRMDPKRRNYPFLTVNCAAITGTLAESALFGHRKGAFTGATQDRPGYFLAADKGTLLLDEISELEKPLQPKLLRVLQEGKILPVGDDIERQVNVRVIAACNRPLPILVQTGEFRLDLYQRLNVISLTMPPLRDRPEDIPPLVQFFLRQYASYYPRPIEGVDERVYEVLSRTIGSGNVRELENAVRQILAFKVAGTRIELSDIPPSLLKKQATPDPDVEMVNVLSSAVDAMLRGGRLTLAEMVEQFEAMILNEAMSRSTVTHCELAQRLGLSRRTFYHKLRKYDLPRPKKP